jgi:hypothetical protein
MKGLALKFELGQNLLSLVHDPLALDDLNSESLNHAIELAILTLYDPEILNITLMLPLQHLKLLSLRNQLRLQLLTFVLHEVNVFLHHFHSLVDKG